MSKDSGETPPYEGDSNHLSPNYESNSQANSNANKKKKQLYIAHRRSPSELTSLMIEQLNLQRQLEIQKQLEYVEQQKQQLLAQQQMQQFQPPSALASNMGYQNQGSPLKNKNRSHRRSQSSVASMGSMGSFSMPTTIAVPPPTPPHQGSYGVQYTGAGTNFTYGAKNQYSHGRSSSGSQHAIGHSRRHSLGLQEAKKAAALAQSQRGTKDDELSAPTTPPEPEIRTPEFTGSSPREFQFPPPLAPSAPSVRSGEGLMPPQPAYGGALLSPGYGSGPGSPARKGHERNVSGGSYKSPGRGHYRTNSRNKDINSNWRSQQQSFKDPSDDALDVAPPFTPSHRPRNSFGGSISSVNTIASYGGQPGQGQRKSLFAPYLPQASLPALIAEGRLVTGTLRVNKKNRSDAYVATDGLLDADVFICGSKDRNRALEGDAVAVELLVVDEVWSAKKEKEEKKRRKDSETLKGGGGASTGPDDASNDASTTGGSDRPTEGIRRRGSLKQRPTQKKNDDLEVEGQSLLLVEEEEINDAFRPLYAGHVVAVMDRIPGQLFAGTLGLVRPSQQQKDTPNHRPKIVWFKPNDKKVPLIAIPTEQAPRDFVEKHDAYANTLFVASIKRWPITSLHPFGTLVSRLGPLDDPDTEIAAILRDNNFACDEFPDNVSLLIKEGVPRELLYLTEFPEDHVERRYFDAVVAVAPSGDDIASAEIAVRVAHLSESRMEVAIHVADVTAAVESGSLLDKKLKKRSVSVSLAQGVRKPLLPDTLAEHVCFKAGRASAAMSAVFQIDSKTYEIEDVWLGESKVMPRKVVTHDAIDSGVEDSEEIATLAVVAKEFRRQRLGDVPDGVLTLLDQLDDERERPSLNMFEASRAYSMMEELCHKVNGTVAQRILAGLGSRALLRRQQLPTLSKYESFVRKVARYNLDIATSDAAALQKSVLSVANDTKRKAVETLLSKCMNRGRYYVAGKVDAENYGHWYYNMALYTHFTAPTRRYADLIVHRQLKAVLHGAEYSEDSETLKMVAEYCNFKKDNAWAAQQQSVHLLLCQTVNAMSQKTGQVLTFGTVIQVYESSFDVLLPEFGIEKRVHGDQLPLVKAEFDKNKKVLDLYWEKGIDSATYVPPDEKQPLSYRSSIKNKFRTSAAEAAKHQQKNTMAEDDLVHRLQSLGLKTPKVLTPDDISETPQSKSLPASPTESKQLPKSASSANIATSDDPLKPYFKQVVTRIEGQNYIQEVRELQQIPILLRSEIGMALPCLTVRTLNPFANY